MIEPAADPGWGALRSEAAAVATHAYAPYSGLSVGAAARTNDGQIITGCNVENASFGLTLCAECGVVSELYRRDLVPLALAAVAGDGRTLMPCGRCRQILLEVGGPELLIDTETGPIRLGDLLPGAFTARDLPPPAQP